MKYHNHKIMMFICATAFSVTACSNSNSFSDPIDFETPTKLPTLYLHKELPRLLPQQPMAHIPWQREKPNFLMVYLWRQQPSK